MWNPNIPSPNIPSRNIPEPARTEEPAHVEAPREDLNRDFQARQFGEERSQSYQRL